MTDPKIAVYGHKCVEHTLCCANITKRKNNVKTNAGAKKEENKSKQGKETLTMHVRGRETGLQKIWTDEK